MKREKLVGAIVIGSVGLLANPVWSHDMNKHVNRSGKNSPIISPRADKSESGEDMNLSSQAVRDAQRQLDSRGFQPGNTEGLMDKQTSEAIADFQQSNGLAVTGTLDEDTVALLGIETNSPSSEPNGAIGSEPRMDQDYGAAGRDLEQPAESYTR
jgi:peptidoglycan hydrolase-like protein with peptidoglycan-binding domain